ncbi:MAG TPA: PQQ-binding-like beta-propeller repeat protein, partial [Pirellulaceae bacterium]|nr:PQQ-binding-like beta-propeller repeat protein [Pirellulaceae bacterium]
YSCGSSVSRTPVAVGETVYVVTDEGQLHALDYKTGRLKNVRMPGDPPAGAPVVASKKPADDQERPIWPVVSGVRGVLAVSPTKLYCLGGPEQLIVLDNNSGARLSTLPIGPQTVLLHNSVTDRLIVANATGLVQCFHERELAWPYGPYVHVNELEKLKATRPDVIQEEEKPMVEAPVKPMPKKEVDPFGGGDPQMEADPFGGGAAQPKPMPKPKVEDDPFG